MPEEGSATAPFEDMQNDLFDFEENKISSATKQHCSDKIKQMIKQIQSTNSRAQIELLGEQWFQGRTGNIQREKIFVQSISPEKTHNKSEVDKMYNKSKGFGVGDFENNSKIQKKIDFIQKDDFSLNITKDNVDD